MTTNKIVRATAIAISSVGLLAGLSGGIVGATQFTTTGPNSSNHVKHTTSVMTTRTNNNSVGLSNMNTQHAYSGDVVTTDNTTALGGSTSGAASNANVTGATIGITNSAAGEGDMGTAVMMPTMGTDSLDHTGPQSNNSIVNSYHVSSQVTNNNAVSISSSNSQHSDSGNVVVSDNTTAGGAQSGSASNSSTSEYMLTLSN